MHQDFTNVSMYSVGTSQQSVHFPHPYSISYSENDIRTFRVILIN